MRDGAPTLLVLLTAVTFQAGCATGYDEIADVRSVCDVPFEVGKVVRVSGEFSGDRYHYSFIHHADCPGVIWTAYSTDSFRDRFSKTLELGNALFIGAGVRNFEVEVEGLLRLDYEGKPAIEFQKLGKSERITR
jgi:hypothetical protein